jgi:hypothetical protein
MVHTATRLGLQLPSLKPPADPQCFVSSMNMAYSTVVRNSVVKYRAHSLWSCGVQQQQPCHRLVSEPVQHYCLLVVLTPGIDSLAWRLDSTGALQAAAVANNATQLLCHSQPRAVHAITHESSQCHKRLEATEQQHVLPTTSCGTSISNKQSPTAEQFSVPSSSHLFLMQWRRHCPTAADKYR